MDLTTRNPQTKTPDSDTDTETPLQTHLSRALSLTNGSPSFHPPPQTVVSYKECLKNHAATLGGLALDGCGEFMPSPSASLSDPTSLKCVACGCHRNFHRRDSLQPPPVVAFHWSTSSPSPGQTSSGPSHSDPNSPASPIPQQSVYPSAPHMLLALSTGHSGPFEENHHHQMNHPTVMNPHGKKRARTKFTEEQKEKMHLFAEKLGWKMMRANDEKIVEEFCSEVGVKRNVFKVWMHNNKHRKEKGGCDINKKIVNFNCDSNYGSYQIESKIASLDDGSSPSSS
ncbi:hypothetical protein JCGZ_15604 [Jatropha curcas]|uniref:ZF-HD dimerization-type domain-containing protein n=1 Tax=Jatropha curcas TaxID=180498 RepID=A0A067KYG4_JATCU|nr:zinc-finger homeodomain protein 11 [Jatropha curcas]KDP41197.1 hypothetical protein JCGZ_15604 [Jatropha curcas]